MASPRRHSGYTVGWVSALQIVLAAAQEMLIEEHPSLPLSIGDDNLYSFGCIDDHNVVIACLPAGRAGTRSAASVAMNMKRSFPSIRFGLMVGIGGGVPSEENDIHLGDVVVSQPAGIHGGVVQYDFRKARPDTFERAGSLNSPSTVLLNALSVLKANYLRDRGQIFSYMSKFENLATLPRPDVGTDVLFDDDQGDNPNVVVRTERPSGKKVIIHYGTIPSGNLVMRYGARRDELSLQLGGILCFEMEAAGLIYNFPCIVIRGTCDYADSHKSKEWQPCAAAAAAAYARELLSVIPRAKSQVLSQCWRLVIKAAPPPRWPINAE